MVALALSGGANRGALEAGALLVLFEHGIRPDMVVGNSAGALNAAIIAADPSLEGARRLVKLWEEAQKHNLFPGNYLTMAWRLVSGKDSLFSNKRLKRFIESNVPSDRSRFADITAAKLYIVAADLNTGQLRLFGEDPKERIVDALMASTAYPPYLPPWNFRNRQYIDGGVIADVPINIALDKGAKEVYAIHVMGSEQAKPPVRFRGLLSIIIQTFTVLMIQQLHRELRECAVRPGVKVHYLKIEAYQDIPFWDFSHTEEMIEKGRRVAEDFFAEPHKYDLKSIYAPSH
jgi:NTE family protein